MEHAVDMTGIRSYAEQGPIVFFLPGLDVGGAERHTIDLRARLRRRGWDTQVLVYGPRRSEAILRMEGAEDVLQLNIAGMSRIRGWVTAWKSLRRMRPGLVVAVNQAPLIVAVVLRLLGASRAPIMGIFHTTVLRKSEERTFFLFQAAIRLADVLVYVSANQRAYWTKRNLQCRKTAVIINGVDHARFAENEAAGPETRRRFGLAETDYVIGNVAALRPEKNHCQLVEAVSVLRRNGIPARALLVGDGPARAEILAKAREAGIEEHVILAGEQADVRPLIAACDVGVLCSNAVETLSLSALEFLSSGVPMIMSEIGGASELVRDGVNGYLFPSGDTDMLVNRLVAAADATTRAGLAAQARPSVSGLSVEGMVDQYAQLLGESLRAPQAPIRTLALDDR
jgi:glycosyltransferase involved in cell wall biosynthesis